MSGPNTPKTAFDVFCHTSTPDTYGSNPAARVPAVRARLAAIDRLREAERHGELDELLGEQLAGPPALEWLHDIAHSLARDHTYFLEKNEHNDAEIHELRAQIVQARDQVDELQRQLSDKVGADEARRRRWHHLELGADGGGRRWFLVSDGYREPVNTGTGLVLLCQGHEVDVRFECHGGKPTLSMPVGESHDIGRGGTFSAPVVEMSVLDDGLKRVRLRFDRSYRHA